MRDFDSAQYTIQQACEVAGLNPSTGRSWFQKGWLSLWTSDEKARTPGATTRISHRSVLALTIAARLVELGAHPQRACKAARHFTDEGSERRDPGELFATPAFTVLAAYADGSASVLEAGRGQGATTLQQLLFPEAGEAAMAPNGRQEAANVLLLDFVVKHVTVALERAGMPGAR